MPLPEVAVQVVVSAAAEAREARKAPDDTPELQTILLNACTDAVAVAQCVTAANATEAIAAARVEWRDASSARIRVSARGARQGSTRVRLLRFAPKDAAGETWRAVGYATGIIAGDLIGSLAEDTTQRTADATAAGPGESSTDISKQDDAPALPEAKRGSPAAERVRPAAGKRHDQIATPPDTRGDEFIERRWWLSGGATTGPGIDSNAWRLGGFARVSYNFRGPFATFSCEYTASLNRVADVSARWVSPGAGGGYWFDLNSRLLVSLRGELLVERLTAEIELAPPRRSDTETRWIPGARLGADLLWVPVSWMAVVIGAQTTMRSAPTDVLVGNIVIATAAVIDYQLSAGLLFAP